MVKPISISFLGSLVVSDGTFAVNAAFTQAQATEENPVLVNGTGRLLILGDRPQNRMPDDGYVVIDGKGALLEIDANNPFKREDGETYFTPHIICRNGGTFQADGVTTDSVNDIHVWDIQLESGRIYVAQNGTMYNNYAFRVNNGTIHSSGESVIDQDADSPNRIVVDKIEVADGTLTLRALMNAALIKTGAGALLLEGRGGSQADFIEIREGTLIASEQLVNTEKHTAEFTTIQLQSGTAFDISRETGTFDFAAFQEEGGKLETNGRVTLITGDRIIRNGDKLISWTTAPLGTFIPASDESPVGFVKKDDGLYAIIGMSITIR